MKEFTLSSQRLDPKEGAMDLDRRRFLKGMGLAGAGAALPLPGPARASQARAAHDRRPARIAGPRHA